MFLITKCLPWLELKTFLTLYLSFCNNTTKPTLFKSDQRFKSGYNIWIMYN